MKKYIILSLAVFLLMLSISRLYFYFSDEDRLGQLTLNYGGLDDVYKPEGFQHVLDQEDLHSQAIEVMKEPFILDDNLFKENTESIQDSLRKKYGDDFNFWLRDKGIVEIGDSILIKLTQPRQLKMKYAAVGEAVNYEWALKTIDGQTIYAFDRFDQAFYHEMDLQAGTYVIEVDFDQLSNASYKTRLEFR